MPRIKHICFDLDGTVTNPKLGITRCIQYALKEIGGSVPEVDALTWCIGPPLLGSLEKILGNDTLALQALSKYRMRYSEIGLYENEVYPGIPETLLSLNKAGYSLIIASSKPTLYVKRILEHFALLPYFDAIHGSELNGNRSDKTELLSYIVSKENIAVEQTVMIGDRQYDVIGARNNGIYAIGVLYGFGSREELLEAGAQTLCRRPDEICHLKCLI